MDVRQPFPLRALCLQLLQVGIALRPAHEHPDNILVPEGGAPVDFSAYGFNADGIKSATIRRQHRPDAGAAAAVRVRAAHAGNARVLRGIVMT
mgnify:CR=1 FL=1